VAGPELIAPRFSSGGPSTAAALFDEAQIRVREILEHLAPDAGWAVWKGAVHEALSRFLFNADQSPAADPPLVTEV